MTQKISHGTSIWLTQIIDGEPHEICHVVTPNASSLIESYDQIKRMPFKHEALPPTDYDVWCELIVEDDLQDGTVVLSPSQAQWLLGTFFKLPPRDYKALQLRGE